MAEEGLLPARYARWRASRLGRITDALETALMLELIEPAAGQRALDVGCGDGLLAVALAREGAEVTGLDADPAMLAAARARADATSVPARFVPGRAEALAFADGTFDRVTASALLCLVSDRTQVLSEMTRVLRPGGRLVLGDLGARSPWALIRRARGHLGARLWRDAHFHTATEMRVLAMDVGLVPLAVRGSVFHPPVGWIAALMAPIDAWLGRRTTFGAAFIVLAAEKPRREGVAFTPPPAARRARRRPCASPPAASRTRAPRSGAPARG